MKVLLTIASCVLFRQVTTAIARPHQKNSVFLSVIPISPLLQRSFQIRCLLCPLRSLRDPPNYLRDPPSSFRNPPSSLHYPLNSPISLPVPSITLPAPSINHPAPSINLPAPSMNLPAPSDHKPSHLPRAFNYFSGPPSSLRRPCC